MKRLKKGLMRVISGTAKGIILEAPRGSLVRPTLDRVKETIFNVIAKAVNGANALDLFAGTGQLGIEALSRGADACVFVEKSAPVVKILKSNLEKTSLAGNAHILKCDVFEALNIFASGKNKFDIVFADPPYAGDFFKKTNLLKSGLLCDIMTGNSLFIIEHIKKLAIDAGRGFELKRELDFGQTGVSILKRKHNE